MRVPSPHTLSALVAVVLLAANPARASVEISSAPTKNMNCSADVCSPTAKKAVLNVTDLTSMLAIGDVKITTGASAITITVESPFSWTSTHRLTLDAYQTVSFRAPVTVAGTGAVTIAYNDGGTGGDLRFFPGAKLDFWDTNSDLVISGKSYALVEGLATLASLIALNPSGFYAMSRHYKASDYPNSPIPTPFSGVVEGLGHTVDKLTISQGIKEQCVGLFETIATGGTLRDLRITHAKVTSTLGRKMIGALAGCNSGVIVNAGSDGLVQSARSSDIGGLVGNNAGTIMRSSSIADVVGTGDKGEEHLGGLVGFNTGNIIGSEAGGNVSGAAGSFAGGLVGWSNSGTISTSHASGAVTNVGVCCGGYSYTGGLVGVGGNIDRSYAIGAVDGGAGWDGGSGFYAYAGGLVGIGDNIANSYALGSVTGGYLSWVGGLSGGGDGISNSYSVGNISGYDEGGFIGVDTGNSALVTDYWDLDTSGVSDPHQGAGHPLDDPGITGLTDAQLKAGLPAEFDPKIWAQRAGINNGYPYLIANPPQ